MEKDTGRQVLDLVSMMGEELLKNGRRSPASRRPW